MRFVKAQLRPQHRQGEMNKTELAYARHLDVRKAAGEVDNYLFESVKFRLADKTYYTPDFVVMLADGTIEVHEVKGHWEDDARVKIKVFREMYPVRTLSVTMNRGAFSFEDISPAKGES